MCLLRPNLYLNFLRLLTHKPMSLMLVQHEDASRNQDQLHDHLCFSLKNHFRLPFTFVTKEVAEATCNCLLAQAEQADKKGKSKAAAERMILEEFGRCLMSVINSAGKAKSDPCAMHC